MQVGANGGVCVVGGIFCIRITLQAAADTADTGILPDQNSNTLSMTINNCGHRKLNSLRTVCETMEHVVVVGRCR